MSDHVITAGQLRGRGIYGRRLAEQLRRKKLYRLLGDVYCDRPTDRRRRLTSAGPLACGARMPSSATSPRPGCTAGAPSPR